VVAAAGVRFAEDGVSGQAISIHRTLSGFKVGVHFADPGHIIDQHGGLQLEIGSRGRTLELPDRTIPMVPDEVTVACRFRENGLDPERRVALTVAARFDTSWRLQGYYLSMCRVAPRHWLTQADVVNRLQGDGWLQRLHRLALQLRQRRREAGELILTEPEVTVRAGGSVDLALVDPLQPGSLIGNELLLLAQELAARFCAQQNLADIYRVGSVASEPLITSDHFDPALIHAQRKLMSRPSLQACSPDSGVARPPPRPRRRSAGAPAVGTIPHHR